MPTLTLLTNRRNEETGRFSLPADGWYQVAPPGRFPNKLRYTDGSEIPIVQVLDNRAFEEQAAAFNEAAAKPNWGGMLIDYDHMSMDRGKSSEAAGWVVAVENRGEGAPDKGLWANIRWSTKGEGDVTGGVFRYVSPVYDPRKLERVEGNEYRPLAMLNMALTNDHNLKGMRPLSNRSGEDDESAAQKQEQEQAMKEALAKLLGLAADAPDDAYVAGVKALQNRAAAADKAEEKVKELEAAQLEAQVEADLAEFAGVIENREEAKAQLLANRESGLALLKALKKAAPEKPADGKAAKPLPNRTDGKVPSGAPEKKDDAASRKQAAAIRNRAAEIRNNQPALSFSAAWLRAEEELAGED